MKKNVPEYFYTQSGVIPFREKSGGIKIMLITSRKKKRWIIPKGVVEPYMTPQLSAAQEAFEEAGLFGSVWQEPVGTYQTEKWGGVCTVTVYPMAVEKVYDTWMEDDFRKRKWFTPEKALEVCEDKDIRIMIKSFLVEYGRIKNKETT